jgi:hypothetical protein
MKKFSFPLAISLLSVSFAVAQSQDSWSPEQSHVLASMHRLSASTAPDGAGADEYGEVLAENFSRWTTGSEVINHKSEWVEGVRSWFNDGWRVVDRKETILEITISGGEAFTRRIVEETYLGPDEEQTISKAALAETWVRSDNEWLLLRVNADVLDAQ